MGALEDVQRRKLSTTEYHRMGEVGILGENDRRVELIEGQLIQMAPIGAPHASYVNRLAELFIVASSGRYVVSIQNPITLPPFSEPQPDIVLLRRRADRYREALPSADDVLLVIEVSDTTLRYDRDIKISLYARHGIVEAWLIDVHSDSAVVHRQPDARGYMDVSTRRGERISPLALPDVIVDLAELWRR